MAPRFLIDENLSPQLAQVLLSAHGFDALHVRDAGLLGASDVDVLALAIAEGRIVMTSNAEDFRKLGSKKPKHPGLAILRDAVGRAQQLALGVALAHAIEASGPVQGRVFEINRGGIIISYDLP